MDDLLGGKASGQSAGKNQVLEKVLFGGEGQTQFRKKLALPDADKVTTECKERLQGLNYRKTVNTPLGSYYFFEFMQEIQPMQGRWLAAHRRFCQLKTDRASTGQYLLDNFVETVRDIYSQPDPSETIKAFQDGGGDAGAPNRKASSQARRASVAKGGREKEKNTQVEESNKIHADTLKDFEKGTRTAQMFSDMEDKCNYECDRFLAAFKNSTHFNTYCQVERACLNRPLCSF